jgi:hypothetical protein
MEMIFAGVFALLIGVVGLWTGFKQLRNRAELDNWPTTKGRVIERGIFRPPVPTGPPAFRHAPLVRYAYQVNGKDFVNDFINPKRMQLPRHSTIRWAQKRLAAIPDDVCVHYNPANPAESFLFPTPKLMLYVVIGGSLLVFAFGALLLIS